MGEITFTSRDGACPSYGNYYIMDRLAGKDPHGNTVYDYALFLAHDYETVAKFRTPKQAYEYVQAQFPNRLRPSAYPKYGYDANNYQFTNEHEGWQGCIDKQGNCWKVNKATCTVEYKKASEQLTGWFRTYQEALAAAKKIVYDREPRQMTMDDFLER